MGAAAAPHGPAVWQRDVVQRTALRALAAAGAPLRHPERPVLDEKRVKGRVHRAAHAAVVQIIAGRGELLPAFDAADGFVYIRFRTGYDLPGLLRLRRVEHGDVVLRHDDLGRAPIAELLLPGKLAVIPGGIADLTAAGHYEPDLLRFGKLRLQQPVPHHSRKPPPIGWRYHNELAACGYRSRIVCFNAVVYAEKRLMQRFRDAPGHIPAVAGA